MRKIESVQNAKVKEWAKLQKRKGRERAGAFLIEGEHLVEAAIQQDASIEALLIAEDYPMSEWLERYARSRDEKCFVVSRAVMKRLSETETPQGIIAIAKMASVDVETLWNEAKFLLLLDAIQDPGNLGAIIRTADAAGVDGIVLGKGTVDAHNAKVIRSTMGSIFRAPIVQGDLVSIMEKLRKRQFSFVAASLKDALPYDQVAYDGRLGIVIGNEANGVSDAVLNACSAKAKIPLYGQAESLNAAVAAGIILYEAVRQRRN